MEHRAAQKGHGQRFQASLRASAVYLMILVPGSQMGSSTMTGQSAGPSLQIDSEVPTLALGTPTNRELSTGTTHRYRLDLQAGAYVSVAVDQYGIDLGARLLAPGGAALVDVSYRQAGTRVLSAIAIASGRYLLEIRCLETLPATGRYVAEIQQQRPAAEGDSQRVLAERLFAEAEALRSEGRFDATTASLERYRRAFDFWTAEDDRTRQAISARRLGEALHTVGRTDEALARLLDSLGISRLAADPEAECAALVAAASVYLDVGKMDEASRFSQQALDLSRKTRDRRGEAVALNMLGDVDMFSGRSRESLAHYDGALAISKTLLDRRGQAQALLNLGYSYADLAQVPEALASYEAALGLWRAVSDRRGQARTLTGLGQLHAVAGENQQALGLYREATELFELLGDRVGLGSTLNGLAMVHFRLGEPATSVAYLRRAVELFRAVTLPNGEAGNLLDLGRCLTALGRHREALEHYLQALAIARAISDRRLEAHALGQVGGAFAELGESEKALRYYQQSKSLAQTVGDPIREFNALGGLAELLHGQGRDTEALSHLYEALRLAERSKHRFAECQARYDLARIQAALGQLESALVNVQASLDLAEGLRADVASLDLRASYLASIRGTRELEIDLLMRLNERSPGGKYEVLAFEASERARARSFLDGLAQARAEITEGAAPELLERERSISRTLNAKAQQLMRVEGESAKADEAGPLRREIDAMTASHREVEAQIRAESPRFAGLTQPKPLTLREVQTLVVNDQSVLLQYFLGKSRSYVWAVTGDEIEGFALPARAEIDRRVRSYRDALTAPARAPLSTRKPSFDRLTDARALSRMLLGPVAAYLSHPRVLIVSDGVLHLLPFSALLDPRTMMSDTQGAVPLIAEHELVYLPSASTLALVRGTWNQERRWPKAARVFADPVFEADDPRIGAAARNVVASRGSTASHPAEPAEPLKRALRDIGGLGPAGVPRLLESRREARDIAALAPDVDVALDFEANRASAMSPRLADYRVIHFATHGIIDNDHPELSGVVLSLFNDKGEPQDGFLRLHDIYNLKLPVDLVVLSACSTALGREIVGEGLIGLVRGFMYAGSRRVLASLWKVDDEATSELMTRFYRALFERGLAPSAALQAAQVELLKTKRWSHPFYWAGFVLQGEWK
jgi:CHAT domain-containing protein/tetratricopeptide (TPR) repeat protein